MTHKDMISSFIREHLDPVIKPLGYRRVKGMVWNRRREAFIDVITLQKAKHSSPSEFIFTGNVAVCCPDFLSTLSLDSREILTEADGMFYLRFNEIDKENYSGLVPDKWWSLSVNKEAHLGDEMAGLLSSKVLPLIERLKTFQDVDDLMRIMGGGRTKLPYFRINRALVALELGNIDECKAILSSVKAWPEQVAAVQRVIEDRYSKKS